MTARGYYVDTCMGSTGRRPCRRQDEQVRAGKRAQAEQLARPRRPRTIANDSTRRHSRTAIESKPRIHGQQHCHTKDEHSKERGANSRQARASSASARAVRIAALRNARHVRDCRGTARYSATARRADCGEACPRRTQPGATMGGTSVRFWRGAGEVLVACWRGAGGVLRNGGGVLMGVGGVMVWWWCGGVVAGC